MGARAEGGNSSEGGDSGTGGNSEATPVEISPSRSASPRRVGSENVDNALLTRFPAANLTVLAHLYRGELARSNVWRQKMDLTTHWAVITTTAMVSLSFTNPRADHLILPFCSLIIFLLLVVESRRYRFYDVWRARVRMLEVHLMVPALYNDKALIEGDWREVLCNDLLMPTYKMGTWEAIGRRLARTYGYLFVIALLAWLYKVQMVASESAELDFFHAFATGGFAPEVVIGVVGGLHAGLLIILFATRRSRNASGEIRRKDPNRRRWPI